MPETTFKVPNLKKDNGPKTGLFVRNEEGNVDVSLIKDPRCGNKNCKLDCCCGIPGPDVYPGGIKDPNYINACRLNVVKTYFEVGGHKIGKFVTDLILARGISKMKQSAKLSSSRFRYLKQYRKGRCPWCRTVPNLDDDGANHPYKPSICPAYEDSVVWQKQNPKSKWVYMTPAFIPGGCPLSVSKTFFQSFYCVGTNERLDRLKLMSSTMDPAMYSVKSGTGGGHNKTDEVIKARFMDHLATVPTNKSTSRGSSRDVFDIRVNRYTIWMDFCAKADPEFHAQAARLTHTLGFNRGQLDPCEYANDPAGRKISPKLSYGMARTFIDQYMARNNISFDSNRPSLKVQKLKRKMRSDANSDDASDKRSRIEEGETVYLDL